VLEQLKGRHDAEQERATEQTYRPVDDRAVRGAERCWREGHSFQRLGEASGGGRLLSELSPKYCRNARVVTRKPGRPRAPKRGPLGHQSARPQGLDHRVAIHLADAADVDAGDGLFIARTYSKGFLGLGGRRLVDSQSIPPRGLARPGGRGNRVGNRSRPSDMWLESGIFPTSFGTGLG